MIPEEIKNEIKALSTAKKTVTNSLRLFVKDESYPLNLRYEILCDSGLGETSWRTDFGLGDDKFLYESPLYMRKYEVYFVSEIFDCLIDSEDFDFPEKDQETFKQHCVDNFISSMRFDW